MIDLLKRSPWVVAGILVMVMVCSTLLLSLDLTTGVTSTLSTPVPTPTPTPTPTPNPTAVPTTAPPSSDYCTRKGILNPINPFYGYPTSLILFQDPRYITADFCADPYPFDWDHRGVDFAWSQGTPVISTADTLAVEVGWHDIMGNYVMLCTGTPSGWCIRFMHLDTVDIEAWDTVSVGQQIGTVGNTGSGTTGTHLHYDIQVLPQLFEDAEPTLDR